MDLNPDKMRAEFWKLTAKRDAIRAKADPVREKRDALVAKHAKELAKHDAAVRQSEEGLFEIDNTIGMLVRALGGKMGEPS